MRRTFSSSPTVNSTGLHAPFVQCSILSPFQMAVTTIRWLPSGAQLKCEPAQPSLKQRRRFLPSRSTVKLVVCQMEALWTVLSNQSTLRARKKILRSSFEMTVWQ